MSATECKRCGGEGMRTYKHVAGGVCFACGRTPAGQAATPVQLASARERRILDIAVMLRNGARAKEEGTLQAWWTDLVTDPDCCARARVLSAPDDVRARAIAAFARLGITV